jgi:hypothetical protein
MSTPSSPVRPAPSSLNVDIPSPSSNVSYDQVSPSTSRGRSFSHVRLPSFRISTPGSPKSPPRRSFGLERPSATHQPDPTQRYRNESRKLLAHILGQLRDRTKPQSVFNAFSSSEVNGTESRDLRMAVRAIQGVVKLKAGLSSQGPEVHAQDGNDSDDEGGSFSTDSTYNLLSQFVSALAVAVNAGWQIFGNGYEGVFSCDKCAQP